MVPTIFELTSGSLHNFHRQVVDLHLEHLDGDFFCRFIGSVWGSLAHSRLLWPSPRCRASCWRSACLPPLGLRAVRPPLAAAAPRCSPCRPPAPAARRTASRRGSRRTACSPGSRRRRRGSCAGLRRRRWARPTSSPAGPPPRPTTSAGCCGRLQRWTLAIPRTPRARAGWLRTCRTRARCSPSRRPTSTPSTATPSPCRAMASAWRSGPPRSAPTRRAAARCSRTRSSCSLRAGWESGSASTASRLRFPRRPSPAPPFWRYTAPRCGRSRSGREAVRRRWPS